LHSLIQISRKRFLNLPFQRSYTSLPTGNVLPGRDINTILAKITDYNLLYNISVILTMVKNVVFLYIHDMKRAQILRSLCHPWYISEALLL